MSDVPKSLQPAAKHGQILLSRHADAEARNANAQALDMNTCNECGEPLKLKAHTERTLVGRYRVDDSSSRQHACANGHVELTLDDGAGYERRAAAIVLAEAADLGGDELRFARKALGLTQARLAALMGMSPETVSRWENDVDAISRANRLALLAIVRDPASLARLEKHTEARSSEILRVA